MSTEAQLNSLIPSLEFLERCSCNPVEHPAILSPDRLGGDS